VKTILLLTDVAATFDAVSAALTSTDGLAAWWTTEVAGEAGIDGTIAFTFGGDFNPVMRVTRVDGAGVSWTCVAGVEQWAENTFRFDLEEGAGSTRVRFRQEYATELSDDDFAIYNFNWAYYLESLRLLCVTGLGTPFRPGVESSTPELISVARATAKADRVDELERELRARVAPTLAQPGNIEFSLYRSLDDPGVLVAFERWRSRPDWERHLQGPHVTSLMEVFEDTLAAPPDIQISTPLPMKG
jgi:quinol monooxygenase YgiN